MNETLPILSPIELRVLGALIEKSKTTPDYYPMTLNAITAACNQKTSRSPVTEYDEEAISSALNSLKGQSLVANAHGGGSRVLKYKHNFGTVFEVSDAELAILCLLMLRGPQTPGELNNNSGRIYEFRDLEEVLTTVERLCNAQPPFVSELSRRPGQKENRFVQLMGDVVISETSVVVAETSGNKNRELEERLSVVEQELAELKEKVEKLLGELL